MLLVIACLAAGAVIGLTGIIPAQLNRQLSRVSFACLLVMLAALGAKLGASQGILQRLGLMGIRALGLAAAAAAGSLVCVYVGQRYLGLTRSSGPVTTDRKADSRPHRKAGSRPPSAVERAEGS